MKDNAHTKANLPFDPGSNKIHCFPPECDIVFPVDRCAKLRERARRRIATQGLREAADAIGVKPDALARFVAGANSHAGTVRLVEDGMKKKG